MNGGGGGGGQHVTPKPPCSDISHIAVSTRKGGECGGRGQEGGEDKEEEGGDKRKEEVGKKS